MFFSPISELRISTRTLMRKMLEMMKATMACAKNRRVFLLRWSS